MLLAGQDVVEVQVHKRRASKIVAQMKLGHDLIPDGVEASANDETGTITFKGPEKHVKYIEQTVRLFDVAPRLVNVSYSVDSAIDKIKYEGAVSVANNAVYTFTETEANIKVQIKPRVNDDGTVTLAVTCTLNGVETAVVMRMQEGRDLILPLKPLKKAPVVKVKASLK